MIFTENLCICCGEIIPEGRQICPNCENVKRERIVRMSEIEKVIKALEFCTGTNGRECSDYRGECPYRKRYRCRVKMQADALELLIRFRRLFWKEDDPEEAMNQMERHEGMIL